MAVGAGVAGLPVASVLSRGRDMARYEAEDRLGVGNPLRGRHPRTPTGAPRTDPAAHHRLPSRTARPKAVRVSHDPDRTRRLAVAEPHPVTPHANGRADEGTVPAPAVHEQPVRPRSVPETREGLL
ncbi:hypothetical protein AMK15_29010 [Streptomyces sp. MJM1172]|nr:hypothetical protein AMK15_29010 [Streptomyces sp. MJM1172]